MQVWIGLKQNEKYVHEWIGEVQSEDDLGDAVKNAIAGYRAAYGKALWGIVIMVDKNPPPPQRQLMQFR